jgi:uncharacterized protein (DUF885 family)
MPRDQPWSISIADQSPCGKLRIVRRLLILLAVIVTLAHGCGSPPPPSPPSPSFDQWVDAFASDWVRLSPQMATRVQYFSGDEQDALDRQLTLFSEWGTPYGVAAARQRADLARRGFDELRAFPRDSLTRQQRVSAAVLSWALEDDLKAGEFARYRYVFDQFNGLHLELVNTLTQTHPIRQRRDIENYLARLALVAPRIDEGLAEARAADASGIRPPRVILERTIEQLDAFLNETGRASVFVSTLDTRIGALGEAISAADRISFVEAAEKTVADAVLPAYSRIRAFLADALPRSTDDVGVWRFPRGAEFYAQELATFTNTSLTPDEIHAIGLREVARIEGEMDATLRQLGYTDGTVNTRYARLEASRQPKGPADPRPQILADYLKWVRDAERRAEGLFDLRPRAPIEVRREPAFSEKTAAAHYAPPAPDGSRPGVFWLPLPGPAFQLLRMRSLSYHEAVPGHHFQVALQQEMTELPRFRRLGVIGFTSAYIEGWALYAERLADESGWYEGDPYGRLGYLNSMLFRARRLVVDTGIHARRWTRQQAIDYGITAQEVERYIVWPGQACSYMIGQLRIVELREQAKAARGGQFSIKEFHNAVLGSGTVPLAVLTQEIDQAFARGAAPR